MIIFTGIIFLVLGFSYAYSSMKIPPQDQAALAQTSVFYYADGTTVLGRLASQNRESVDLNQIPQSTRYSVLAAEDHTFYTNKGVDPKSIARAAWADVRGNSTQGGSTISEQYVKNIYNRRQRSYKRKFDEVFLAVKINQQESKDEILKRYLNTIYLGRGAYGIQAASQAYFGENVEKLTVSQGAYLAGIINAPSAADPRASADQKARALFRWNTVLNAMVKEGWLDPATRAKEKFPTTIVQKPQTTQKGQSGYLMQMAKNEAVTDLRAAGVKNVTMDSLNTGGYKVVTTFNKSMVAAGVKAVKDKLPKDHNKGLKVGMASIDVKTGAVKAIYGGPNFQTSELNEASQDRAEGGSSFKAFALIAALQDGVSLQTTYSGKSPAMFKGDPKPVINFDHEQLGYLNLIQATEQSVNTIFVRLNQAIGADKTLAAAEAAGIPANTPNLQANLVNVLGSANVHPVDLASAYGTFASGGVRRPPYSVQSISYVGTGKSVYKVPTTQTRGKRVFTADNVADLDEALEQVIQGPNGTATVARQLGRPVAGKTGTSTDSKSAWFVAYTPNQLVTAVAFHQEKMVDKIVNGKKVKVKGKVVKVPKIVGISGMGGISNITGGSFPAVIWTEYMEAVLAGKQVTQLPTPVNGGTPLATAPATATPTPTVTVTVTPTAPTTSTAPPPPTSTGTGQPKPTDTGVVPTDPVTADPTDTQGGVPTVTFGNGNGDG
jgi:membrane peptidoglycan carboxypeptidase